MNSTFVKSEGGKHAVLVSMLNSVESDSLSLHSERFKHYHGKCDCKQCNYAPKNVSEFLGIHKESTAIHKCRFCQYASNKPQNYPHSQAS